MRILKCLFSISWIERAVEIVNFPAVPAQVPGLQEGHAAVVGVVVGMGAHVLRQVAGSRARLAAGGSGVGAVAGKGARASRHFAGLQESLTAGSAGIGAFAGVCTHVLCQVVGPRARLAESGAGLWALAGMGAHACRRIALVRARLAADGALKDHLAALPSLPLLADASGTPTISCASVLFLSTLVPLHRHVLVTPSAQSLLRLLH